MFQLVFHPADDDRERIPFTVSEADLDDAVDVGRAERSQSLAQRMRAAAYHMVLELRVCRDVERISGEPWVLLQNGKIVARNHLAAGVRDEDLA
jgi:hypothetical protein